MIPDKNTSAGNLFYIYGVSLLKRIKLEKYPYCWRWYKKTYIALYKRKVWYFDID
jgi:hypothetical protein